MDAKRTVARGIARTMPGVHGTSRRRGRPRRRLGGESAPRARLTERALHGLFVVVVSGSVLALGSVHPPAIVALAVLSASGGVLAARAVGSAALFTAPTLLLLGLSAYSLLQAVPLPMAVLEALQPSGADTWARALRPFGEPAPTWASVSLDPAASVIEATKWASYSCVCSMATAIAAKSGARWVAGTLFASGLIVALVTLAHGLVDAERVYGVYEPTFSATRWRVGPLLNPNNLAGYSNLAILAGAGILVRSGRMRYRWPLLCAAAALLACIVLAASRAGLASLLFGAAALVVLLRRVETRGAPVIRTRWLAAGAAGTFAVAVSFALLASQERTTADVLERNVEKVEMWKSIPALLRDHAAFGVGRGAFASVFPAYRVGPEDYLYAHAENFALQWLAEWGVPAALLAFLALAFSLRPRKLKIQRSPTAAALWVAIVVVFVHNLADLGLEVPAVGVAVFAALGALWGVRGAPRGEDDKPRRMRYLAPAVTGVAALFMLTGSLRDLPAEKARVADAYRTLDPRVPAELDAFMSAVRTAMSRHPADPYFPRLGAVALHRAGRAGAVAFIGRALERGPRSARNHYTLALILARRGAQEQALMELRLAATYYPGLSGRVARIALAITSDAERLERVIPEGPIGALVAVALARRAVGEERGALRERLLELATLRDPRSVSALVARAEEEIHAMSDGRCEGRRTTCEDQLARLLRTLAALGKRDSAATMARAKIKVALGQTEEAVNLLISECPGMRIAERGACVRVALQAALASDSEVLLSTVERQLGPVACYGPEACANLHTWVGDQLAAKGHWDLALGRYERALREQSSDERAARAANAAMRAGSFTRALELLQALSRRHPENPKYHQQMERARAGLLRVSKPP